MASYGNEAITSTGSFTISTSSEAIKNMFFKLPPSGGIFYFQDTNGNYTNYLACYQLYTNNGGGIDTNSGNITIGSGTLIFKNGSTIRDTGEFIIQTDNNMYFSLTDSAGTYYFQSAGGGYNNALVCGSIYCNSTYDNGLSINMVDPGNNGTWTFKTDGPNPSTLVLNNNKSTGYYFIGKDGSGWVWYNGSDINVKNNINIMQPQLDNILKLNPVTFNYKNIDDQELHYGFIAQEVEDIYPYCVNNYAPNDEAKPTKYLNMQRFIPFMVKATQEQQSLIIDLQNKLSETTNLINNLQKQIDELRRGTKVPL